MSRLYGCFRLLPKSKLFFDLKLCALSSVNSRFTTNGNFQPCNIARTREWAKRDPFVITVRSFSKSKGKLKKGVPRVQVNDQELSRVFNVDKLYSEFKMPVDQLKKVFVEQLNLRLNANAMQDIKVNYDNTICTIRDLAEIQSKSSKEVVLDMGCFPDAVKSVMDSLRNSAFNVNPTQDGTKILVPIPKVTQERRESSAKKAKAFFNKCKERIRDVQNKNIKEIDKKERLSEDDVFRLKAQLTLIAEKHTNEAEEIYKAKEKELLSTE